MKQSEKQFFSKHDPKILPVIRNSVVGIAGAGGLGSNVAFSLARVGVGTLIIADFDKIEPPDLNRQQYFVEQIGKLKVEALFENLKKINPYSEYKIHSVKISENNVSEIFGKADILVEAFDEVEMKKMLIESWLYRFPEKPIIAASGLAGFGKNEIIHIRKSGSLYICGDEESECKTGVSPMAPRVAIVANMQANLALELLLTEIDLHG
ncbi:MAG: sulfur carrier protein ThiS adenylyltransferase ThiF [Candidatus Aminicenantes bacterium]|nr:sulfur carrier protein ThiS adenylyltransferase ThiF [Candidatus Aminicenantes bacterium]